MKYGDIRKKLGKLIQCSKYAKKILIQMVTTLREILLKYGNYEK